MWNLKNLIFSSHRKARTHGAQAAPTKTKPNPAGKRIIILQNNHSAENTEPRTDAFLAESLKAESFLQRRSQGTVIESLPNPSKVTATKRHKNTQKPSRRTNPLIQIFVLSSAFLWQKPQSLSYTIQNDSAQRSRAGINYQLYRSSFLGLII